VQPKSEQVERLLSETQNEFTRFVIAELALGLTYCRMAKSEHRDAARRSKLMATARRAHDIATEYMWKVHLEHPDFNRITADSERLALELGATQA
jgi:hypothetical protein